jgi:hypothetical protein
MVQLRVLCVKGFSFMNDKAKTKTDPQTESHIDVRPLYTPADLEEWDYDKQVGYHVPWPPLDHAPVRGHG